MFAHFWEFYLKFKPKKGALFQRRVEFLGRQVSSHIVEIGDSYVEPAGTGKLPALLKMWIGFLVSPTNIETLYLVTLKWHFPSTT